MSPSLEPAHYLTDIEIAQRAKLQPIEEIAAKLGLGSDDLECHGRYKAKIQFSAIDRAKSLPRGKLILVTAMTPTPAGEGKTTLSIGLAQALSHLGKKTCVAIREPSLGPVFGVKGGAAGGGYSQVVPMEDINLHFTGDIHAITTAHNLLVAMLDNHIHQGNLLAIDPRTVTIQRCLDVCDRALRHCVVGLGGPVHGVPRETGFEITAASEVMAIHMLSKDIPDLKRRLGSMLIAYTYGGHPVTASQIGAVGAMAAVLRDALKPNLVQTLEGTPAFVHSGPFGNVAAGCSSVTATMLGLQVSDYLVTEAGFGSDLGAEKFIHIKCRSLGIQPNVVVIAATIRALKMHGGQALKDLEQPSAERVASGMDNLLHHVEIMRSFGLPVLVALNHFVTDTAEESEAVLSRCKQEGIPVEFADIWAQGGKGGVDLANRVVELIDTTEPKCQFHYQLEQPVREKIEAVASKIYGASEVRYTIQAERMIQKIEKLRYDNLPICFAKTQNSLSDDPTRKGRPRDFHVTVRDLRISSGAGFLIVYAGEILTMFGFPERPAAEAIDLTDDGQITGLF